MSKNLLMRFMEAFFSRRVLCLLPLLALFGLGAYSVAGSGGEYQSTGVLAVQTTSLITDLTEARADSGFTYETPASLTSRQFNDLMSTDEFANDIAERAGLTSAIDAGAITLDTMRGDIGVWAAGDTLLKVRATTIDPELSQRLATSAIESFIDFKLDEALADGTVTSDFFDEQIPVYEKQIDTAQKALSDYLTAHKAPTIGDRPEAEQAEIDRLTTTLEAATSRYDAAVAAKETAQLVTEQARSDVELRFREIDSPNLPGAAQPKLKAAVMTMAMFTVMGTLLSLAVVIVFGLLDKSVRFPDEVKTRLQTEVLAVVPNASR